MTADPTPAPAGVPAADPKPGIDLRGVLGSLATGSALSEAEAVAVFSSLMEGRATSTQVGALLMAMRVRGETLDEIVGATRALRSRMVLVEGCEGTIDTCGTGGDGAGTFNVSTAVAFVVAGCGVPVAKHSNRAMSSRSGAADVLEELGIPLEAPLESVAAAVHEVGVGFLFAPRHHEAMRHVAQNRREIGTRTIFNLIGPLSNPARSRRQLLGVFSEAWAEPLAGALGALGSERAWVVHGADGLDELTTTTHSVVAELRDGRVRRFEVSPEDAGLPRATPDDLKGGDARENAAALRRLLDGETGPYRDIVLLNAAAALVVADRAGDLAAGCRLAAEAIDSGVALGRLAALIQRLDTAA